jgi:predicted TPR repeat methyltransferase|tara:strand:- start:2868 stop:3398 length:531 start_codon:yes stop_codon:yes gene_type:complete
METPLESSAESAVPLPLSTPSVPVEHKLAPFNPVCEECLNVAVELFDFSDGDVLFDLGCGDGRSLVACALDCRSLRCVGVECDERLALRARARAAEAGVADRVTIVLGDACTADLSSATKIFVYLVPDGLKVMQPVLTAALDRGVTIVSYMFSLPDETPTEKRLCRGFVKVSRYTR